MVDVNGTVKVLGGDKASGRLRPPRFASDTRCFIMGRHVAGFIKTSTSVPIFGSACLISIVAISAASAWLFPMDAVHKACGFVSPALLIHYFEVDFDFRMSRRLWLASFAATKVIIGGLERTYCHQKTDLAGSYATIWFYLEWQIC